MLKISCNRLYNMTHLLFAHGEDALYYFVNGQARGVEQRGIFSLYQRADFPAQFIAQRFGITGMLSVHSTACASSASAFVSARNNLYAGNCDVAIVGGVDIASLSVILGFASLEAMSDKPTNPFSANRSGLSLGDAAVFFVVTKEPCADLCTAKCEGLKVVGFGESADADHITAPRAAGEGAYQAMKAALNDAGLDASQIGYVNLHGTGTELNVFSAKLIMLMSRSAQRRL